MKNKDVSVNSGSRYMRTFCALLLALSILSSCTDIRARGDAASRLAETEGRAEDSRRIAELKNQIRGVERDVESTIESVRDLGTYWRLLGLKYMDYRMWGEAAAAFDEAIMVFPEHAVLHYYRALCRSQLALAETDPELRLSYFNRSAAGHQRAVELDSRYTPPKYALAVLLVYELGRPLEAAPYLLDYLAIQRSDVNARFLLAQVYLEAGRTSDALDLYDEITEIARDRADVLRAEELYNRAAGGGYGS